MCSALEESGLDLEILQAQDGAEALAMALDGGVDIVVSDINMPRLDGIGLLRGVRARADAYRLPVILVTSQGEERQRQLSFEAGASDYLYRPFANDELVDRVRVQLRLRALHAELDSADAACRQLGDFDAVTGLANRKQFASRLEQAVSEARAAAGRLCIAVVAIDRERVLARTVGTKNVDAVVVELAALLHRHFVGASLVAHVGDGKFAVLAVGGSAPRIRGQAEALLGALRAAEPGALCGVTVSAGVFGACGDELSSHGALLDRVEALLEQAASAGGDRVEVAG